MEKFQAFMENHVGKLATKASKNKYISTLANGFMTILPVIMIGSFASLFSGLDIEAYQNFITNTGIKSALGLIIQFTTGINSVYLVFTFTYLFLKKKYQGQALTAALVALCSFMILTPIAPVDGGKYISFAWLGAQGMFLSIIVGLGVARLFELFFDKGICIKMPKGVPNMVEQMYKCLVPAIVVLVATAAVATIIPEETGGINGIIYSVLSAPFSKLSGMLSTHLILDTIIQGLWFFGIHGGNATSAISGTLYTPGTLENIASFAAGEPMTNMITNGFTGLTCVGTYTNICLCIMCIRSKKKEFSSFGKMSILPTLFSITEPMRFGLPTVLNFYLFIPIVLTAVVNNIVTWIMMSLSIIGYPRSTFYHGAPFFFNSVSNLGVAKGILLMVVLLIVDYIIIYPFFKMYEKNGMMQSEEA